MGRNRLTERRVLRRASDLALLTPIFQQPVAAAPASERTEPPDDLDDDRGSHPIDYTFPAPTPAREDADLDWGRPAGTAGSDGLASPSMRAGEYRHRPWYRAKKPLAALLAAAAAGAIVCAVLLAVRSPATEDTTSVDPTASTNAPAPATSAQIRAVPSQASAPPPPPVLLPPQPPPPAATITPAPVVTRQNTWPDYTEPQTQQPTKKPEFNVTRAPASATPPPPPTQDRNSSTPGDGPKRRFGGWHF